MEKFELPTDVSDSQVEDSESRCFQITLIELETSFGEGNCVFVILNPNETWIMGTFSSLFVSMWIPFGFLYVS